MTDTTVWTQKSIGIVLKHLATQIDILNDRVRELESNMPCPHNEGTSDDYNFDGESEYAVTICNRCGEEI